MINNNYQKQSKFFQDLQIIQPQYQTEQNQTFRPSLYKQIYNEQFYHRKQIIDLKKFSIKLPQNSITHLPSAKHPVSFNIKKIYSSKNNNVMKFEVVFSYFGLLVNVLNLSENDKLTFQFQKFIDSGRFGSVFQVYYKGKTYAVKQLPLPIQNSQSVIYNAIKQFSIMKVLSVLEVAPAQQNLFGFDLITTNKAVYFSSQKCISLKQLLSQKQEINRQRLQNQLQDSLLLMHRFFITHCDIKPDHILYSPSLKKFVFIDFGLSQQNNQRVGQMKLQKPKGSLHYCCDDMRKLFLSGQCLGYVDMYYNDLVALQKTFKEITQNQYYSQNLMTQNIEVNKLSHSYHTFNLKKQHNSEIYFNKKNHIFLSFQNLSINKKNVFNDLQNKKSNIKRKVTCINFIHLVSSININKLQKQFEIGSQFLLILNEEIQNVYFIFLEIQFQLDLYKMYLQIIQKFKLSNFSTFYFSEMIHDFILKPYFLKYMNNSKQIDNIIQRKYLKERQKQKILIQKRVSYFYEKNIINNRNRNQILIVRFDLQKDNKQNIQKIFQFIKTIQRTQMIIIAQVTDTFLTSLLTNFSHHTLKYLINFNTFFNKIGIIIEYETPINQKQGDIEKLIPIYFEIIYRIYFYLAQNFSTKSLFLEYLKKYTFLSPTEITSKFILQKINKFSSFIKQFQNVRKCADEIFQNDQLQDKNLIFQFSLNILVKTVLIYQRIETYNKFKILYNEVIQIFNCFNLQYLSFKLIIQTEQIINGRFFIEIGLHIDSMICKLLSFRLQIMLETFLTADKNNDLLFLIHNYEGIFTKNRMVQFTHNFRYLCEKFLIRFNKEKIISYLQQLYQPQGIIDCANPESLKKVYTMILLIHLVPKQLYNQLKFLQKYFQIYKTLEYLQNPKPILNNLKEFAANRIISILFQEDKFAISSNFFQTAQISLQNGFTSYYEKLILQFDKKMISNKKLNPIYKAFEKNRIAQPRLKFSFQKKEEYNFYLYANSKVSQDSPNNQQSQYKYFQDLNQQVIKTPEKTYQTAQNLQLQNQNHISKNTGQFMISTVIFHVQFFLKGDFDKFIENLKIYNSFQQKRCQNIKLATNYLIQNQKISYVLLSIFGFKQYQSFWLRLLKQNLLTKKIKILDKLCSECSRLYPVMQQSLILKKNFLHLKNKVLYKCVEQIKSQVSRNFQSQQEPLIYYQVLVKLNILILKYDGFEREQQKQNFYYLINKFFKKSSSIQKYYFSLQAKFYDSQIETSKKIKNPFLNKISTQLIFIDLLVQNQKNSIPLVQKIIIINCEKIRMFNQKDLSQKEKMKQLCKYVFYYMKQNEEINRFFLFRQTYTQFICFLIRIGIEEFLEEKKCEFSKQFMNQENFFIQILLLEVVKFGFSLTCSHYSYFCIKVIQHFFQSLQSKVTNQNCLVLIKKLNKFELMVLQKMASQTIQMGILLIIESQIHKYKFIKLPVQYKNFNQIQQIPQDKIMKITDLLLQTKFLLQNLWCKIDNFQYLVRTYIKQRALKLLLLTLSNQSNFSQKKYFYQNKLQQNKKKKLIKNQKYLKLKYFRSIRKVHQNLDFVKQKKDFILNIDKIQEIFESICIDQFKILIINQYRNSSLKNEHYFGRFSGKIKLALPKYLLRITLSKIEKLKNNLI